MTCEDEFRRRSLLGPRGDEDIGAQLCSDMPPNRDLFDNRSHAPGNDPAEGGAIIVIGKIGSKLRR